MQKHEKFIGELHGKQRAHVNGNLRKVREMQEIIKTMFVNEPEYEKKYDLPKLRKKMLEGAKAQERENIHSHYDIGNNFYRQWLDETMSYSCAYFKGPNDTLYQAQLNKIDLALKKLNLKSGEKLLDIGCGWGWLIIRAAQQYGVEATGITLSIEQYKGAKERIRKAGLEDKVDVRLCNYMDLDPEQEQFDKIASIGMFEHVGKEFLPLYMQKANSLLRDGGAFLLHSIMGYREGPTNEWIKTYIFPGGYLPTVRETVNLFSDFGFYLLHMESLRRHYALTLEQWRKNFDAIKDNLPEKYDERFKRMWELYLVGCAAAFRTGNID